MKQYRSPIANTMSQNDLALTAQSQYALLFTPACPGMVCGGTGSQQLGAEFTVCFNSPFPSEGDSIPLTCQGINQNIDLHIASLVPHNGSDANCKENQSAFDIVLDSSNLEEDCVLTNFVIEGHDKCLDTCE